MSSGRKLIITTKMMQPLEREKMLENTSKFVPGSMVFTIT